MRALLAIPVVLALFDGEEPNQNSEQVTAPAAGADAGKADDKAARRAARKELRESAVSLMRELCAVDAEIVADAFLAVTPDATPETLVAAVDAFKAEKPHLFLADGPTQDPEAARVADETIVAVRAEAREAIAQAEPVDVDIVTDAFIAAFPDATPESVGEDVAAFIADKPHLFKASDARREEDNSERYIVETTTVFEMLGSTVTYRSGQIIKADSREYEIARDHDVPLRPLAPIVR